jgi:ABC-type transport system involved in multi-copper enzyme maturation permease subunit
MMWLTWRLHRTAGVIVVLVVILCAVLLTHFASDLQSVYRAAGIDCSTAVAGLPVICSQNENALGNLRFDYENGAALGNVAGLFAFLLYVLPGLLGVFIGAPLLAREFEGGTHRLVWTQGISRARWLATKVGLVLLAIALTTAAFGTVALLEATFFAATRLTFDVVPPVIVAHAIFAIALGVAAGTLLRNTPAATVATFIGYAVTYIVVSGRRWTLLEPARFEGEWQNLPPGSVMTAQQYFNDAGQQINELPSAVYDTLGNDPNSTLASALHDQGIVPITLYQPFERFWLFQAMETAIFLALAAALIALTFLIVHRRDA